MNKKPFTNLTIALPESRQLDILADLFTKRDANVIRCPLVAIHDSPKSEVIKQWLNEFITTPPDILIILTGEGIRRLTGFAERFNLSAQWRQALSKVYKIARGPKPNRALKELDLQAQELALEPTTDGMLLSLDQIDLSHKRLAVQLYGEDPNKKLQNYLQQRNVEFTTVAPYIYASDVETEQVIGLIQQLSDNKIDIICFTSKSQYTRMEKVADQYQLSTKLKQGLQQVKIAAVGPVVADQLRTAGYEIAVMPQEKYFMKPMATAVEKMIELS